MSKSNLFFILIMTTSLLEVIPSLLFKIFNFQIISSINFFNIFILFVIIILWCLSILIWLFTVKKYYYSVCLFYLISFDLLLVIFLDIFILNESYNLINIAGVFMTFGAIFLLKDEKNA